MVVSSKTLHFVLLKIRRNVCLAETSSASPKSKVFFFFVMKNTNLDEVSGLNGDRPPLPHAVSEPGDVDHVHAGQTGGVTVL